MVPLTGALPQTSPSTSHAAPANVLLLDTDEMTTRLAGLLRGTHSVASASTIAVAREFLRRSPPDLIVTELQLRDGSGADLCREARALPNGPSVLAITETVDRVPDALAAGCDGVLLKPFPPNLLCARIGRLLRDRSTAHHQRSNDTVGKSHHLLERSSLLRRGTNQVWPTTHCPCCEHAGATSFEFASHRRAWYACLECGKVWIAKRQE